MKKKKKNSNYVPKIDKIIKNNLEITIKSRIMLWHILYSPIKHMISQEKVSILAFCGFHLFGLGDEELEVGETLFERHKAGGSDLAIEVHAHGLFGVELHA